MDRFQNDIYRLQPEDTPNILYKYRSFDAAGYHLKIIEDSQLWFASARDFNDPFDSVLQFCFADRPRGIQMKWALDFVKRQRPHMNHKQRRRLACERLRDNKKDPGHFERFKRNSIETNYDKFGICCLTPTKDDLLMWAHYSDYHRGFCIGIDTARLLEPQHHSLARKNHLLDLVKVIYADKVPEINFYESMLSNRRHQNIIDLLCTKSVHWSYEQEFRLIYWHHTNTALSIGQDIITEVHLGCRIEEKNRDKTLSLLDKKHSSATVFQAHKSETNFALEFEQIR
jgi:hypothetical protein